MLLFLCAILLGAQNCNKNAIGSTSSIVNLLRPQQFLQQPQRLQRTVGICENATNLLKLEAHPIECNKFYMCLKNYSEVFSCPAEHYYDDQQYNCIKGSCAKDQHDKQKIMNTNNNNNHNNIIENKTIYIDDDECQTNTLMKENNDCTAFYICLQGRFWRMNCPPGRYFDTSKAKCELISNNVQYQCSCKLTENTLLANNNNITTYYKCNNGRAEIHACNQHQYFNASLGNCLKVSNKNYNNTANNNNEKLITTSSNNDNHNCKNINLNNNEKKVHAIACHKYLLCLNGRVITKICKKNNYYDVYNQMCMPDLNGQCNKLLLKEQQQQQISKITTTNNNEILQIFKQQLKLTLEKQQMQPQTQQHNKKDTKEANEATKNKKYEKMYSKFVFFN